MQPEHSYARVIDYVRRTPWAVTPETLAVIVDVLRFRAAGGRFTREQLAARVGVSAQARLAEARTGGGTAVIGLRGLLAHRAAAFDDVSGPQGTSMERFGARFRAALADDSVGSIVLDVDSPGGAADGITEMGDEIFAARGEKPIVAVANTMAASAGYWLASQADEVVATPSALVGSIGVFAAHEDLSERLKMLGVNITLVSAGRFKVEGNPFEPLDDDGRAAIQTLVDTVYRDFVGAVARGRGVKAKEVRAGFGEGRVLMADAARAEGMVDRVETLDATLQRLQRGRRRRSSTAARQFAFRELNFY